MSKIRLVQGGGQIFFCPGCDSTHSVNTTERVRWTFNGSMDRPTFSSSILVTVPWSRSREPGDDPNEWKDEICHSFVTDGKIKFLGDCTHALAGQTVEIPDWPYEPGKFGGIEESAS